MNNNCEEKILNIKIVEIELFYKLVKIWRLYHKKLSIIL